MRFDYYWRTYGNNSSKKYKQNGYEIESRGYLLFFLAKPISLATCAEGSWRMGYGRAKKRWRRKGEAFGGAPFGGGREQGRLVLGAHGERSEPKSDRYQATERGGRGLCVGEGNFS